MVSEYSRMFLVDNRAEEKGFMDSPTAEYNNNLFTILQGEGGRQWLQCINITLAPKPSRSRIWKIVPSSPNDKNALLDACLAFAPEFFESCESLNEVKSNLPENKDALDFDLEKCPEGWEKLREEARPIFEKKIRITEFPIPGKLLDSNGKYNAGQKSK